MILQPDQRKRFMKLLDELTLFVNEQVGAVSAHILGYKAGQLNPDAQAKVMQELWEDPSLIDGFVEQNPAGLSRRDLNEVRSWRQGITGYHTAGRADDGSLALLTGGYVFEVRGITREIEEMLAEVPCVLETMIVPFDGRITYTAAIAQMQVSIGENMRASIAEEIRDAIRDGKVVSSARDFARVAEKIEREREAKALEEVVSEAEGILAATQPVPGTHPGALAGLDGDARAAAVEEHDRKLCDEEDLWLDDPVETMRTHARSGSPKFTCAELLGAMRKDDLEAMVYDLAIEGARGLRKAELAQAISAALQDDGDILRDAAEAIPAAFIGVVRSIIEAGGRLYIPDGKVTFENTMPPREPLVFLYHTKGCFVYIIPDELMAGMRALDWNSLHEQATLRENVRKLATAAAELRGAVPLAEFIDDCRAHFPQLQSDNEIVKMTLHAAATTPLFTMLATENDVLLLDPDLAEAYLDECEDEVGMEEGLLLTGPLAGLVAEVLDAQAEKEPRPIDAAVLGYPVPFLWRETLPAARAMRDWLDNNVPDGADDYRFADDVVLKFLDRVKWGFVDTNVAVEYLEMLRDAGLELDEAHIQQFLDLLMSFVNTQPIWTNNGWSPNELASQR